MRHLIALIFSCFFLIVSSAAMAETVTVKIQDFSFIPKAIRLHGPIKIAPCTAPRKMLRCGVAI